MTKLSLNALTVLQDRYLWRKKSSKLETPDEMFERVAKHVSKGNLSFKKRFLSLMQNLEFLPNSPTLMNAGKKKAQLAACFVLPLKDDLSQIMDSLKLTALIHQSGGGTGFSFSQLRHQGSVVASSHGTAAGPLGFLNIFNELTENIKQGGLRRGANMGILSISHPDIEAFIKCKSDTSKIKNFNISVSVTNKFMNALIRKESWPLIDPKSKKVIKTVLATDLFERICEAAWATGEPGLIFIDEINKKNPTPQLGPMEATNPCGEQPLLPYEACNLGSINLNTVFVNGEINYNKLSRIVEDSVLFLNNVIDTCHYPSEEISKLCLSNRKIGLGVMGFSDLLIKLKIRYGAKESYELGSKLMKFIRDEAIKTSIQLAKKAGPFKNYSKSLWKKTGVKPLRNATLTTIAPTGTISLIADCSAGIEPIFNFTSERHVLDGKILKEIHPEYEKYHSLNQNKLKNDSYFVTARDLTPIEHVRMQAEFQKYSDSAVSKTINLAKTASSEDVKKAYLTAYELKCKGITVYRDGSRPNQVMQIPENCPDCTRF
ncbi:MAG: adenosylcobalamin-dependent ribonucleoside-diphosphate reductase [Oligoflexia bacterium]|nr:adenosylcobalamin-dependent ribonucleoside-diphosphate reductase [Oligoflexia bacterium]